MSQISEFSKCVQMKSMQVLFRYNLIISCVCSIRSPTTKRVKFISVLWFHPMQEYTKELFIISGDIDKFPNDTILTFYKAACLIYIIGNVDPYIDNSATFGTDIN
jgi:hypothetical protein